MANKVAAIVNGGSFTKLDSVDTLTDAAGAPYLKNVSEDSSPTLGGNLDTSTFTVDGRDVSDDGDKLDTIESNADVTDATNVAAAGATMDADTSLAGNGYFLDEDNMASDDATKVPSQQSVKAFVESEIATAVTNGMTYKGSYDADANTPDLDSTPIATAVGDTYTVTVAGDFFTAAVEIGDVLIAETTNPTTEAEWTIVQSNLTPASIKTQYESNADTNAFTDADESKLDGIASGAEVNLVDSVNGETGVVVIDEDDVNSGNGTIASAASTDIGGEQENRLTVTGTTTITSFGTVAAGIERTLVFADAVLLTHNASSLILPTGANITTAAGDVVKLFSLGSGNWRITNYERASGLALAETSAPVTSVNGQTGVVVLDEDDVNSGNGTIASAATTAIGGEDESFLDVTGTTTITAFGTIAAGIQRDLIFADVLVLTHNGTSLKLPGEANITTVAGDRAVAHSLGSGNWVVLDYVRKDGTSVVSGPTTNHRQMVDFTYTNAQASLTDEVVNRAASTIATYRARNAGTVIGLNVASETARSAGTITASVTINGSKISGHDAVIDASNTTGEHVDVTSGNTYVAGDLIGIKFTSDAGWLPVTDLHGDVTVEEA